MQKPRKIPMRMCVGCREMREKKTLKRVVRLPEGSIAMDATGKAPGRGAYVCSSVCFEKALKTRALDRALGARVDESVLAELKGAFDSLA